MSREEKQPQAPKRPWPKRLAHDLRICVTFSVCYSAVAAVIGCILCMVTLTDLPRGWAAAQGCVSGLLIAGSIGLLIAALFFLFLRRKDDSRLNKAWKKHFQMFPYEIGILVMGVIPILLGVIADAIRSAVLAQIL